MTGEERNGTEHRNATPQTDRPETAGTPNNTNESPAKQGKKKGRNINTPNNALWEVVKQDYLHNPNQRLNELAKKYSVSDSSLRKRKFNEQWEKQREQTSDQVRQTVQEIIKTKVIQDIVKMVRKAMTEATPEALNTIIEIMRGNGGKQSYNRFIASKELLYLSGFKVPDNIAVKLETYTELIQNITINGTLDNESNKTIDGIKRAIEIGKQAENVSDDASGMKAHLSCRATLQQGTEEATPEQVKEHAPEPVDNSEPEKILGGYMGGSTSTNNRPPPVTNSKNSDSFPIITDDDSPNGSDYGSN